MGIPLLAVIDNNPEVAPPFADVPLLIGSGGFARWRMNNPGPNLGFLVAIGGHHGKDRGRIRRELEEQGLHPLTAQHRTAFVAPTAVVGRACRILARATIAVDAVVGANTIVNTSASVDHECKIGEGVHIAPGAVLAGCVEVGAFATIWTGATVLPRVRIGEGAQVGAGAVVLHDVEPYTVVVGNPARRITSPSRRESSS